MASARKAAACVGNVVASRSLALQDKGVCCHGRTPAGVLGRSAVVETIGDLESAHLGKVLLELRTPTTCMQTKDRSW